MKMNTTIELGIRKNEILNMIIPIIETYHHNISQQFEKNLHNDAAIPDMIKLRVKLMLELIHLDSREELTSELKKINNKILDDLAV
jgi:hypothetical protein